MVRFANIVVVALLLFPATATGQTPPPPDPNAITDHFVPGIPGLLVEKVCTVDTPTNMAGQSDQVCSFGPLKELSVRGQQSVTVDATGTVWADIGPRATTATLCPEPLLGHGVWIVPLNRLVGPGITEEVARFQDICAPTWVRRVYVEGSFLDIVNGILYLRVAARNEIFASFSGYVRVILKISGLPSLFDVALTFQPTNSLSWQVPARPFALPGADTFSLYTGNLATVSDLSQATPLVCEIPSGRTPVPGEILTVPDTLPEPSAGSGRYYLATATHQGQTRAGRSNMAGQFHGRVTVGLHGCPESHGSDAPEGKAKQW